MCFRVKSFSSKAYSWAQLSVSNQEICMCMSVPALCLGASLALPLRVCAGNDTAFGTRRACVLVVGRSYASHLCEEAEGRSDVAPCAEIQRFV